jgi:hypothetical protein
MLPACVETASRPGDAGVETGRPMIASPAPGCKYRGTMLYSYLERSTTLNGSIQTRNATIQAIVSVRHQKPADRVGVAWYRKSDVTFPHT